MKLVLIRHGQTQWNSERRVQGRTDIPLNEKGRAQAQRIAERLKGEAFDAIYASPLLRASETAKIIAQYHSLPVEADGDIIEIQFGKWEGLTSAELNELYHDLFVDWGWIERPDACSEMGSESQQEVLARSLRFVERLRSRHGDDARVLVVCHTMPIKLIIAHFIGIPYNRIRSLHVENCSYNELETGRDGRGALHVLNDCSHLGGIV